ncbi:hypothetical protein NQZ68_001468 [Dissostichus eleginoides]|nr:hypothetical protein NQZ68_001468 [Dissostichus eleginoides]
MSFSISPSLSKALWIINIGQWEKSVMTMRSPETHYGCGTDNILLPSSLTRAPPAKSLLLYCHLVFSCKSNPSQSPVHKASRPPSEAAVPPSDRSKDPGSDLYE